VHSVEYSHISYWDTWCKVYYPKEFLCASLTCRDDDKKKPELVDECRRLGLELELPKIGRSDATNWVPAPRKDGPRIYISYSAFRGVGNITAAQLERDQLDSSRPKGFIIKEWGRDPNRTIVNILQAIEAFDDKKHFSEVDLKEISKYFIFNLSKDKMGRYAKEIDHDDHARKITAAD
jgi:DNA polymerase III alpha subunit